MKKDSFLHLSLRLIKGNKKECKNNGKNVNFNNLENASHNPTLPPPPKNISQNSDVRIIEKDFENQHTLIQSSSKAWASQEVGIGLPGGLLVKNPLANARDRGSIPGPGRFYLLRSN